MNKNVTFAVLGLLGLTTVGVQASNCILIKALDFSNVQIASGSNLSAYPYLAIGGAVYVNGTWNFSAFNRLPSFTPSVYGVTPQIIPDNQSNTVTVKTGVLVPPGFPMSKAVCTVTVPQGPGSSPSDDYLIQLSGTLVAPGGKQMPYLENASCQAVYLGPDPMGIC